MKKSLFREEALRASQGKWLGDILLTSPLNVRTIVWCAALFFIVCMLMLYFASYTRRGVVTGVLVPEGGVIKVYAYQPGLVTRCMVSEGEAVEKGQPLYVISSERRAQQSSAVQSSISQQAQLRKDSLFDQIGKTRLIQQEEEHALSRKIRSLEDASNNLVDQINLQKAQVKISYDLWNRYKELQKQNFISGPQVEEKEQAMLEQKNRLRNLEHNLINASAEIEERKSEFRTLSTKQQTTLGQLQRDLALADQEFIESEAKRELMIVAPESGVATGVFGEVGQAVDVAHPLLSIARNRELQVRLYVPTRFIGSVRSGTEIRLRYQAFPYQRFGFGKAIVTSVSRTAFLANELSTSGNLPPSDTSEPLYIIDAKIVSQAHVRPNFSGKLRAGMRLEAEIQQEKHRLIEWIVAPMRGLYAST
jgi:membrane fusion protein